MSWKKNVFSCLMWAVYALIVGTAMIFIGRVVCNSLGVAEFFGILIPACYLLLIGILVSALHRMAVRLGVNSGGAGKGLAWIEGIAVFALFAAGIFLRMTKLQSESFVMPDESVYLELSFISADGQGIPQFSHGAVYFYIWTLRLCFMLLGNKAAAAVWMQIALQMLSVLLLHFAVRKMAGRIPAIMTVFFFMLSPYMVEESLVLSPEMLFLLFFSSVLLIISQGVKEVPGWGFWLVTGVMSAALAYLDVAGFLLLPLMLGVIVMQRQDSGRKIAGGLCGCLAGFLSGAVMCVFGDALSSGKPVSGIIRAWGNLYHWGDLQLSVTISGFDMVWMITLILCFMAWGIFSFWCSKGVDRFIVWIFCLCIAVSLQCLNIFTEEMNGFCYIFFFSIVLAGLGIRESMAACPSVMPEEETAEEKEETEVIQEEGQIQTEPDGETRPGMDGGTEDGEEKTQITGEEEAVEDDAERDDIAEGKPAEQAKGEMSEGKAAMAEAEVTEERETSTTDEPIRKRKIEFLENPLPLPKKHEKRVMDYKLDSDKDLGGYDITVADDDDFDH